MQAPKKNDGSIDTKSAKKIAIVGIPNCGKSEVFNKLTKSYSPVANYPQTTISVVRKKAALDRKSFEVIDTPGISSLNIFSEEEMITRNTLLKERPDVLLFCGDAARLKSTLVLLIQIFELEIPSVFCLNMMDEAVRKGIIIDSGELSREVYSPVIETAAIHSTGLKELKRAINTVHPTMGRVRYAAFIEKALIDLLDLFPDDDRPSRGLLLLYLIGEDGISGLIEMKYGEEILSKANNIMIGVHKKTSSARIRQTIFNAREAWADRVAERVTTRATFSITGFTQKAAWASRHTILGWPILLLILWATFYGVGTIATKMAATLDNWIFVPLTEAIASLLAGLPLFHDFMVGEYGILTMGVFNAIGTVVPILIVFFLITSFLEDVGYLPNLSVLLNRFLSIFGLTGKSVLPIILGFGCNTMATLTCRTLESKKERLVASFLIALGIPCAVQLGVLLAIMATAPFSVLLITVAAVFTTQIISGITLHKLVRTERKSDFILELPPFRIPDFRHVIIKTYYRVKWFLVEAVPLFVVGSALMFALKITGLLTVIKAGLRPVVTEFLSLPDKITEVFILVLARRELGAVYFKDMVDTAQVD
ncbi:MAG: ferrous iron transport protein B, partial [Thermodesulfovibrionia bacterium]|nr:ferrous iron transport protein B [Thermodesulfovibrionia bacterium]